MSHLTKKRIREREKNSLNRVQVHMNTGTIDMGKIKREILSNEKKKEIWNYNNRSIKDDGSIIFLL